MSINQIFPFISTALMLGFTIYVLQRFFVRRSLNFLFWGIGLAMFGAGSFAEAYLSLAWNPWIFFVWYLFGAALNAAWIGHGTLYLLVRKPWVHVVTVVLVVGSLFAGYLMLQVMPKLDAASFTTSKPVSEQYGTKVLDSGSNGSGGFADNNHHLSRPTGHCGARTAAAWLACPADHTVLQHLWTAYPGRRSDLFGLPFLAKTRPA